MGSQTRGFLFADLRGYTRFADSRGDRAAAELLATYRSVVRAVIGRLDGAEIRTEGDSFYIVFPSASTALEAGIAILHDAAATSTIDRPLKVGVGVHAGETFETDEGLVGTAVNIAARVCASADAGELLATGTVRSLTRTLVDYRFVPLGSHRLKGVEESIPLFRVEAVGAPASRHLRRRLRWRRRRLLAVVAAAAIAVLALGGAYAANQPVPCLAVDSSRHDVVAKVDPQRGCVVGLIAVGRRPVSMVAADGAVWIASTTDKTITRHDPTTGATTQTSADGPPDTLATDTDTLWVLHQHEAQISAIPFQSRYAQRRMQLPVDTTVLGEDNPYEDEVRTGYSDMAASGGRLWFPNRATGQLLATNRGFGGWSFIQVDPPGTPTRGQIFLVAGTGPIAAADGTIWIANAGDSSLSRLNPGTTTVERVSMPDHGGTTAMLAALGSAWTAHGDGTVVRAGGAVTAVIPVGRDPVRLAFDGTAIWIANGSDGTVSRVDPATNTVTSTIAVGSEPHGLAALDGSIYVALRGP